LESPEGGFGSAAGLTFRGTALLFRPSGKATGPAARRVQKARSPGMSGGGKERMGMGMGMGMRYPRRKEAAGADAPTPELTSSAGASCASGETNGFVRVRHRVARREVPNGLPRPKEPERARRENSGRCRTSRRGGYSDSGFSLEPSWVPWPGCPSPGAT
jgi:hypothetical protein